MISPSRPENVFRQSLNAPIFSLPVSTMPMNFTSVPIAGGPGGGGGGGGGPVTTGFAATGAGGGGGGGFG